VSIVTPTVSLPWTVTTATVGFSQMLGPLFDGANVWVTDNIANTLLKLDGTGAILQTVTVGAQPAYPVFDGTNIWVPNATAPSVSVVRASSGAVLATLTGNGLIGPWSAAFDGQRVLITNPSGNNVSLWKAADLTPIGSFGTGSATSPYLACSDGVSFWIALKGLAELARF
jgi:DNA-binding beta-propeller fold protein YncE